MTAHVMDAEERAEATVAPYLDGPTDPGLAGAGQTAERGSEVAAHALLRLVGDAPGQMGRLRAARAVGGFAIPARDGDEVLELRRYAVDLGWPLREVVALVDALIAGGLVAQTPGPRPVLALTRPGHRALDALEHSPLPPG